METTLYPVLLSGRMSDRVGRRLPTLLGATCIVLGVAPFLALSPSWSWPMLLPPLAVLGIGVGLATAPIQTAAIEAAPPGASGQAAGLFSMMRYFGSILGSAGMAAVLSANAPSVGQFRALYALLLVAALGACIAAAALPARVTQLSFDAPTPAAGDPALESAD